MTSRQWRVRTAPLSTVLLGLALGSAASTPGMAQRADGLLAARPQDTAYTRQISRGEVTLELLPRWEDSVLVVAVTANTHSVDLSRLRLGEQSRLIIGDAEVIPAETGSLAGHHAKTTLIFRLEERPDRFTIEIRDVPDVPVRKLTWPEGDAVRSQG